MKKNILIASIFSVCSLLGGIGVASVATNAFAQEASYQIGTYAENYVVNDTIEIPDGKANLNGTSYDLTHVVRYPSGYRCSYDDVVLSEEGEYVVYYSFTANGTTYTEERKFSATSKMQSLFINQNDCEISSGVDVPAWSDHEFNGVSVNFKKSGASIVYEGLLNLNNASTENHFIEYIVTPSESGMHTINSLTFTLTDMNDPNNYVVINSYPADGYGLTHKQYIRTAPCGMYQPAAWVGGMAQERGYAESSSFNGKIVGQETSAVRLSYVSTVNASYSYATPYDDDAIHVLLDYDNANQIGKDNVWEGFSNNYVRLTITADSVIGTGGSILITSVNGQDLSGTGAPEARDYKFLFDTHGYAENALPRAVAGKPYEVFDTTVMDNYGRIYDYEVTVRDSAGKAVPVQDGYFIPPKAGSYYINYKIQNGEESTEKSLRITASNKEAEPLKYVFDESMSEHYFVGDLMELNGVASGGTGFIDIQRTIWLGDEEIEISKLGEKEYIRFEKEGNYLIEYVLRDMLQETAVFRKYVDVSYDRMPKIITPPVNQVGLVNRTMTFPKTYAYMEMPSGTVYYHTQVLLDGDDITESMAFTPKQEGVHKLVYRAVCPYDESLATELVYEIRIGDPNGETIVGDAAVSNPYISAFMYLDNFSQSYVDGAYRLTAQGEGDTAYMQFKTPIPIDNLTFNFLVEGTKNNFEGVKVYFTDSEDPTQRVEMYIMKMSNNSATLYINGIYAGEIVGSFDGSAAESFMLTYDKTTRSIRDYSNNTDIVHTYTDWKAFEGFDSGLVIVSLEMVGISGEAELKLGQIANQYFVSDSVDESKPIVVFKENYATALVGVYGQKFHIPEGMAYDVLSEDVSFEVTIVSPTQKTIYRGEYLSGYEIELNEIGRYSLTYIAEDESGNTQRFLMSVYVYDTTAPVIEVSNVPTTAKVGEAVSIPQAQITDDYDETPDTLIYVRALEDNSMHIVKENEYTFKEAGVYEVIYYAMDSENNATTKSFTVTVE